MHNVKNRDLVVTRVSGAPVSGDGKVAHMLDLAEAGLNQCLDKMAGSLHNAAGAGGMRKDQ